jgi:hypothetical protein
MRKSYVMVYADAFAPTHKALTDILDQLDPACDWHVPMPRCVLFTSSMGAHQLAKHFEEVLGVGSGKLFLITEVSDNKQGRLTDRGWRLLNDPENPRGA